MIVRLKLSFPYPTLTTHTLLWPQKVWGFHSTSKQAVNSAAAEPAGQSLIQLSPDAVYLETASDPTSWGLSPQECPLLFLVLRIKPRLPMLDAPGFFPVLW
jgi:hypothetical protein